MARNRKLRAFAIGDAVWQDVDDPEMFGHAQIVFDDPIYPTTRDLEMTSV